MNAYLDVETSFDRKITVIGIFKENYFKQFIGRQIQIDDIKQFLSGVSCLYTFNGFRFDFPMIKKQFGLDVSDFIPCKDLMYDCGKKSLFGGLKRIENQLGISRTVRDVNGLTAMELWERFEKKQDENALVKLLSYNKEDTYNLMKLHRELECAL